jgi:hypothetical protein
MRVKARTKPEQCVDDERATNVLPGATRGSTIYVVCSLYRRVLLIDTTMTCTETPFEANRPPIPCGGKRWNEEGNSSVCNQQVEFHYCVTPRHFKNN